MLCVILIFVVQVVVCFKTLFCFPFARNPYLYVVSSITTSILYYSAYIIYSDRYFIHMYYAVAVYIYILNRIRHGYKGMSREKNINKYM